MFYGRLSDVSLGVITLAVTLILFKLINSTAGDQYVIGSARLGGFNGIHGVPTLNMPGNPSQILLPNALFYVSMGFLLVVYCALRWLLISHFGRMIIAIRENEQRAQLLGYDVRCYKTVLFSIGGAIAGLAGALFVNWGGYADPGLFSLFQSAQIIIWVIVGGLGTLIGPVIGACLLHFITSQLGALAITNNNLILGAILIIAVLLMPRGIVPGLLALWRRK
jgi:branched-chain amino acid transport system permease protein